MPSASRLSLFAALIVSVATLKATAQDVTQLVLIDADADVEIAAHAPLVDGATLDLASLPTRNLNVRADVNGPVGSVRFSYDLVADFSTENVAPYALAGDNNGDYGPWTPTIGAHTLTATPYIGPNATGGTSGAAVMVSFTVVDRSTNQSPTANAGPDRFLILPTANVVLNGSANDVDGVIDSYAWSQVAGPAATLSGTDTPDLSASALIEGSYVFRLTVTDDDGAQASDDATVGVSTGGVVLTGELMRWHRITLTFDGQDTAEDATPNPFRDARLIVSFTHDVSQTTHQVPGFYAADGSAAETSANSGGRWRTHFTPDLVGDWSYVASFRTGTDVAVDLDPQAGTASEFDGLSGGFTIEPSDKSGKDNRGRGRLEYVSQRYLRFAGSGEAFLKGGADSPENFLGYFEFDDTVDHGGSGNDLTGGLHRYTPHVSDWTIGDPSWQGGKGKGIIGALNYLSSVGGNSVYFLTMNVNGDGREVYPWSTYDADFTRFDCSKLAQWEIVFSHMDALGIQLHVLLQETENDSLLNGGDLGLERKLYYREMIARFGHHLALEWNLGEETRRSAAQHRDDSEYIDAVDPYDHPIVLHTYPGDQEAKYAPLLGWPHLDGPSIQINGNANTHARTREWIDRSAAAGHPWFVSLDEQNSASAGVVPDADDYEHDEMRQDVLWGNLMAGGAGVEWYFGYNFPHSDLDCEDWRSRHHMWELTHIAVDFFHTHLPFDEMTSSDQLVNNGWCLAKPDDVYAVYLPSGGTTDLDLNAASGTFSVRWFDPRAGGPVSLGSVETVSGGSVTGLGDPPNTPDRDWSAVVRRIGALHRGVVPTFTSAWKTSSLPLTSGNDDETGVFPVESASPGSQLDDSAPTAPLILYRLLRANDEPEGNLLRAVRRGSSVDIAY